MKKFKLEISQLIMLVYLIILIVAGLFIGISPAEIINASIIKICMNALLVLSLLPMINAGMGMNFGMAVGASCGTIGMLAAVQFKLTGGIGLSSAMLIAIFFATILGFLYGKILNFLKGNEEIVGMFTGLCFIPLANIFYTLTPFSNRQMLYLVGGVGLRPKINLNKYFGGVLDSNFVLDLGEIKIPILLVFFFLIVALIIRFILKSKLGDAMEAVAENRRFVRISGIDIDKTRIIAVIFSSIIAAVGLIVYAQTYGFIEAYAGPTNLVFPAISAILIGGGKRSKASISNAIIGVILYQCTYLLSVPVANRLLVPQMAEIIRMFITNVIILYAFLYDRKKKNA